MKIQLHLAVLGAMASATIHRLTHPNAVALGNDGPPVQPQQTPPPDLAAENAALKDENARLKASQPKNAAAIREKMAAGLTREQAEAAVRHQGEFTKRFAKRGEKN